MKRAIPITTLFLDTGGISLANGWDHFIDSILLLPRPQARCGHLRLALGIAQAPAQQVVDAENTSQFIQIAEDLGIRSIPHSDYMSTCVKLVSFGLQNDRDIISETS